MPDSPQTAALIEAAARPLADNAELHLAAAGFLSNLETAAPGAHEAVSRWNAVDARPKPRVWRIALWLALVIASVAAWLADSADLVRYFGLGKWSLHPFSGPPEGCVERVSRGLDAKQKLLLFGDLTKETRDERMEALWRSEPENPAYFSEYAAAYLREHQKLPPDFLETARRIDPDNAWFTYLAAAVEGKESVRSKPRKGRRVNGKRVYDPPAWEILDHAKLDRAQELIGEARDLQDLDSYSVKMFRSRLPLLPRGSLIETVDSLSALPSPAFATLYLRNVATVLAAKAWTMGEAGEVSGFRELNSDAELLLSRMADTEKGMLVDELVFVAMARTLAEGFAPSAEKLGFLVETERWKTIAKKLQDRAESKRHRSFIVDGKAVKPHMVSGIFGVEVVAQQAESPPPLTDADLKPGRMIDHEILSRFCGYLVWLLTGLCLGLVALYRFRVPVLLRRLARRVEDLLRPVDWLWILGGGVVLPFALVMAVNRLTPLGGRDFGVRGVWLLLPAGHFLGLLVLWLLVPAAVIRWRLARRAAFLGFSPSPWAGLLAITCAVAFVPVIGWAAISGPPGGFWSTWIGELGLDAGKSGALSPSFALALGLLAVAVLWLAAAVFGSLTCPARGLFFRVTESAILVRALAAAMLLAILATPAFKAAEQAWFQKDTLTRTDAATPGWTRYEYLVAVQMRKEIREILGMP